MSPTVQKSLNLVAEAHKRRTQKRSSGFVWRCFHAGGEESGAAGDAGRARPERAVEPRGRPQLADGSVVQLAQQLPRHRIHPVQSKYACRQARPHLPCSDPSSRDPRGREHPSAVRADDHRPSEREGRGLGRWTALARRKDTPRAPASPNRSWLAVDPRARAALPLLISFNSLRWSSPSTTAEHAPPRGNPCPCLRFTRWSCSTATSFRSA